MPSTEAVMTAIPVPHMQRLLEDVARREGFRRPRYAVSAGSKVGDNYLGLLFRVEVAEHDGAQAPLKLILKGMPTNARRRQEMRMHAMFDNEYEMYRNVLPSLARFLADKGEDIVVRHKEVVFPNVPRCVDATRGGAEGEDTLVLDDMRPLGFTMHDRRQGLDEHHVGAVFRSLAYLHATSFAMEEQQPNNFRALRDAVRENIFTPENHMMEKMPEIIKEPSTDYIRDRFPEDSIGYKKFQRFLENYATEMCAAVEPSPSGGNVISHGDCWSNNLLFRYCAKTKAVQEACLLDFQISRYAPPVLDLLYLAFTGMKKSMRDAHLDRLFKEYHDELSATLRRLGCDPDIVYPWQKMQEQLHERGKYGLGMAVILLPLILADNEEIPDMDKQFDEGVEAQDIFKVNSLNATEKKERIGDVLQEMMDRGWF